MKFYLPPYIATRVYEKKYEIRAVIINELDNSIAEYVDNPPNPLNCKTLDNYVIDLPSELPRELP
jgi:hypothetical protein